MTNVTIYPKKALTAIAKRFSLTKKEVCCILSANKINSEKEKKVTLAGNVFLNKEVCRLTKMLPA